MLGDVEAFAFGLDIGAQPDDHVEQLMADPGIQAYGWLVQEQDSWRRDECPRDLKPTPLASAVARDGATDQLGEAHRFDQLGDPPACLLGGNSPEARVELETRGLTL